MTTPPILEGRPDPMGATFDGDGVNFAVFSEHGTRVTLCLFSEDGETEQLASTCPSVTATSGSATSPACGPASYTGFASTGPTPRPKGTASTPTSC